MTHATTIMTLVVGLGASAAMADKPAFIEATSERDEGKPQTSMWNAVDGNPGTMWCSQRSPGQKEAINFTFEEPVVVTSLGLTFVGKDGVADKTNKRPRIVYVADVDHRVEAKFKDTADTQVLELSQPARGTRVVVEFEDTYAGATDDAPVCVAEIVLRAKTKDLTEGLGAKARGVNTPARKLLHQWHDDISAPSRTLIFNVDGTFMYRFEDFLGEEKPVKIRGKWSAAAGSVTLDVGGKSYRLNTRVTAVDGPKRGSTLLNLSGTAPHPSMIIDFSPAPLMLP
jgi:hypothetical protein